MLFKLQDPGPTSSSFVVANRDGPPLRTASAVLTLKFVYDLDSEAIITSIPDYTSILACIKTRGR
jgi:hypothetical protein